MVKTLIQFTYTETINSSLKMDHYKKIKEIRGWAHYKIGSYSPTVITLIDRIGHQTQDKKITADIVLSLSNEIGNTILKMTRTQDIEILNEIKEVLLSWEIKLKQPPKGCVKCGKK